jgi:hypothetical protein
VDLTDLVVHAGVKQDALGGRRLAGIDVGHDADVARPFEWILPGHGGGLRDYELNGRGLLRPFVAARQTKTLSAPVTTLGSRLLRKGSREQLGERGAFVLALLTKASWQKAALVFAI